MARSTMGIGSPLLICFVIVAAVTFAECSTREDESLMWPSTPICMAEYNETDHSVKYSRIVGLDSMLEELSTWDGWEEVNPLFERVNTGRRVAQTNVTEGKVVYPSVLLVMDYHDVGSTFNRSGKWHPGQLLMYALGFWNSVRTALKDVQNPRVAIQIAGIIITDSRGASPYLAHTKGAKTFSRALLPMLGYFGNNSTTLDLTKAFFMHPFKYDIVVHMTDLILYDEEVEYPNEPATPELVAALQGPVCRLPNKTAAIIVNDDMEFVGVPRAVEAMRKVFGLTHTDLKKSVAKLYELFAPTNTKLTDYIVKEMFQRNLLYRSTETCMSARKDPYHARGPFPPILQTNFVDHWSDCQIPGYYTDGAWDCRKKTSFSSMSPLEPLRDIQCNYRGPPLKAAGFSHCW